LSLHLGAHASFPIHIRLLRLNNKGELTRIGDAHMKSKPDDRSDNVEKIQHNINSTIRNMEAAEDMMARMPDGKAKRELERKNERRERALEGMRKEIRDEAKHREEES
jgi:small acid-soluble spore protein (thioredoxin-like protein)